MTALRKGAAASGGPGQAPRWTAGCKTAVGCAASPASHLWYTLSGACLTEIFFPSLDKPQVRLLTFAVTDGQSFVAEESDLQWECDYLEPGVPGFKLTVTDPEHDFRLAKEVIADSQGSVLLVRLELQTQRRDLRCFVFCNPHLNDAGQANSACILESCGQRFLSAHHDGLTLALAGRPSFRQTSCGYIGTSDGLTQLRRHYRLKDLFEVAKSGNVGLCGELETGSEVMVGLALGSGNESVLDLLQLSLSHPFELHRRLFSAGWRKTRPTSRKMIDQSQDRGALLRDSLVLLHVLSDKTYPGALPAAPALPWGQVQGDKDRGGYHLCWTRDLTKVAVGMLACGWREQPLRSLIYLSTVQRENGGFPQNFWMDGRQFMKGSQLDEVAFPILLAHRLFREDALQLFDPYPMVISAAAFLLRYGPVTEQERWEEVCGLSPSTLAVCIAALVAAAAMARARGDEPTALFLEQNADGWEEQLENWTVTRQGSLVTGITRHYVRINPVDSSSPTAEENLDRLQLHIGNREPGKSQRFPANQVVDAGFLELVRYGIRAADDRLIEDSVEVVDHVLRVETPGGPCWRRYNHDGYGQKPDGSPFDSWGVGRPWPLLAGERGHYEVARKRDAGLLIQAMEYFAGHERLLPEQIRDGEELPDRDLWPGGPTGSARPLLWAHSEYLKLLRSRHDGEVYEKIPEVAQRYQHSPTRPKAPRVWSFRRQVQKLPPGRTWRIVADHPFRLRWSLNHWDTRHDESSVEVPRLKLHYLDLEIPSAQQAPLQFTFYWPRVQRWEGRDYSIVPGEKA